MSKVDDQLTEAIAFWEKNRAEAARLRGLIFNPEWEDTDGKVHYIIKMLREQAGE